MKALDKAIKLAGTTKNLAEKIGVTPMAVTQWGKRGVPVKRSLDIEAATEGEVTRHDLRPDIFGPAPQAEQAA